MILRGLKFSEKKYLSNLYELYILLLTLINTFFRLINNYTYLNKLIFVESNSVHLDSAIIFICINKCREINISQDNNFFAGFESRRDD